MFYLFALNLISLQLAKAKSAYSRKITIWTYSFYPPLLIIVLNTFLKSTKCVLRKTFQNLFTPLCLEHRPRFPVYAKVYVSLKTNNSSLSVI